MWYRVVALRDLVIMKHFVTTSPFYIIINFGYNSRYHRCNERVIRLQNTGCRLCKVLSFFPQINAEFRGRERTTVCILKYEWNMPHNYRKRNRNWSEGTSIFKYFCWPVVMRAKQVARKLSVSSEELKSVITNYIWNIYC